LRAKYPDGARGCDIDRLIVTSPISDEMADNLRICLRSESPIVVTTYAVNLDMLGIPGYATMKTVRQPNGAPAVVPWEAKPERYVAGVTMRQDPDGTCTVVSCE